MSKESKNCQVCKAQFTIEPDDFAFYNTIHVPPPTFCWKCRLARRLGWRNERSLYKRLCDLCKRNMISMHKPGASFPVYCRECWWGDTWDPLACGVRYDSSQPFFAQFAALQQKVPRPALYESENVGSDYCNHTAHNKNCYLMFGSWFSENCGYGQTVLESRDCWDCLFVQSCEGCMYSVDCTKCYQTHWSRNCTGCADSAFLYDCRNCQNCLLSWNLRNKSYHILNKPASKEEFTRLRSELLGSHAKLYAKLSEFRDMVARGARHKYMTGEHNKDISGEFIYNAKNVRASYWVYGGENEKYAVRSVKAQKDSWDIFGVNGGELGYDSVNVDFSSRAFFSVNGENNVDTKYCIDSFSTAHAFGCISLRRKNYCILNMQYTEAEFGKLQDQIVREMQERPYQDAKGRIYSYGEFFPYELSPFGYNETLAQEYVPTTREQARELGFPWHELSEKDYVVTKRWNELQDSIAGVDDSIVKETILCEAWDRNKERAKEHNCTKAFRIILNELTMYRKFGMPLPRKCPNTRNFELFQSRNPVGLWKRNCMCNTGTRNIEQGTGRYKNTAAHFHGANPCPNEFETSYSPDRQEIVYCEQCYQSEIV